MYHIKKTVLGVGTALVLALSACGEVTNADESTEEVKLFGKVSFPPGTMQISCNWEGNNDKAYCLIIKEDDRQNAVPGQFLVQVAMVKPEPEGVADFSIEVRSENNWAVRAIPVHPVGDPSNPMEKILLSSDLPCGGVLLRGVIIDPVTQVTNHTGAIAMQNDCTTPADTGSTGGSSKP